MVLATFAGNVDAATEACWQIYKIQERVVGK